MNEYSTPTLLRRGRRARAPMRPLGVLAVFACAALPAVAQTFQQFGHGTGAESITGGLAPAAIAPAAGDAELPKPETRLDLFHGYIWVLITSFLVTLIATPVMRRLAVEHGVIDRPNEARKTHKMPIAYLGGAAVFCGIVAGIFCSYAGAMWPELLDFHRGSSDFRLIDNPVPISVLVGLVSIVVVGLIDDVVGTTPRVKIGGQLIAAAALAADDVGVKVAAGLLIPLAKGVGIATTSVAGVETIVFNIPLPSAIVEGVIPIDVIYWAGTAIIALFVLGACNASNLIDGLDGLLSGVTAICVAGLLVVSLSLAVANDGPRDAQRIVLCMAVLGACLGFLPHNFNPATIFLGDTGSLLLGYCTIVIILTLGDTGKTHLVAAGLIIYAIPLIDTTLAIIRRKMAGKRISDPDSDHLHHMLKRALGVKGAVFTLYGIGLAFATLGVLMSLWRARVIYALVLMAACYIGVIAIKIARKKAIEDAAAASDAKFTAQPAESLGPPTAIHASAGGAAQSADRPEPAAR